MSKKTNKPKGRPRGKLPRKSGKLTPAARLAKLIREARESKGIDCAEAAVAAGLSLSRWYDIEAGRCLSSPKVRTLRKIAAAVGANVTDLTELAYQIEAIK